MVYPNQVRLYHRVVDKEIRIIAICNRKFNIIKNLFLKWGEYIIMPTFFQRVKLRDLIIFYRQFATMVDAGLTLVSSLDVLIEQENKTLSNVIRTIKSDIEGGSTLADACSKHPRVFSELYISMIRAGEVGGVLDEILNKIPDLLEKEYALRQKIKSAMAYPTFLIVAVVIMAIFNHLGSNSPQLCCD